MDGKDNDLVVREGPVGSEERTMCKKTEFLVIVLFAILKRVWTSLQNTVLFGKAANSAQKLFSKEKDLSLQDVRLPIHRMVNLHF